MVCFGADIAGASLCIQFGLVSISHVNRLVKEVYEI
jgi:hypothetical protein